MATAELSSIKSDSSASDPWKACFVISAIGEEESETRIRADHVFDAYIEPSCRMVDCFAVRADEQFSQSIRSGVATSLERAPMCIAYLGSPPWNQNVLIELGYRISAHLPVVVLVDGGIRLVGQLPYLLADRILVSLPTRDTPDAIAVAIKRIASAIQKAESDLSASTINSKLPVAIIHSWQPHNGGPLDPRKMMYVRASDEATRLLGIRRMGGGRELVGRTMADVLQMLKGRMTDRQFDNFMASQDQARRVAANGTPHVNVPIVFNRHPFEECRGRAYLPIITESFLSPDRQWSSLRILYLDVSSSLISASGSDAADANMLSFACKPMGADEHVLPAAAPTVPAAKRISVFLSHTSEDWETIRPFMERLADLSGTIDPWVDRQELYVGDRFVKKIGDIIESLDLAFIFVGPNGIGRFQDLEIDSLVNELTRRPNIKLAPVYINAYDERSLTKYRFIKDQIYDKLKNIDCDRYLINFFDRNYPGRFWLD